MNLVGVQAAHAATSEQLALDDIAPSLLAAWPVAAWWCDVHGDIRAGNAQARALWGERMRSGASADSLLATCSASANEANDAAAADPSRLAHAVCKGETIRAVPLVIHAPAGAPQTVNVDVAPLHDAQGATRGMIVSFHPVPISPAVNGQVAFEQQLQQLNDTLEQRVVQRSAQAQTAYAELHRSERNFALLVASVVDYAIYMLDTTGHIISWNAGAERIKGYPAEEVMGRHFSLFYTPEERAAGVPDKALHSAARDGRYGAEGWRIRRDGSRFWASVVVDPIFDAGKLIGFAKITRDVTRRRDNELALLESERLARGIIDSALDGFVQVDEAGLVMQWNPRAQAMLGWPREQVLGRSLPELLLASEDRARLAGSLPPALRDTSQDMGNPTIEVITRDGRKLPVELSISTLPLTDGCRYNVFFRDLSDKLLVETQLRQAQKMEVVGQLTSGLAHDFNNLLQGVIGALELIQLRADAGRADEIGRFVTGALGSANRAAALTHRLLAFSRRQPLDPRPLQANPLIVAMGELLQRTLGERITVQFELATDLWTTLCDPNQLESALLNLALNARDAMPGGGQLTIRSRNIDVDEVKARKWQDVACGAYICIDVSDTGGGMPAEVLERAFDPFFTTKQPGQGTGLGLSMVYGFAHQSKGHCDIHSTPGHGATVRVYLPRNLASVPATTPDSGAAQPHVSGHGEVVLVVEDELVVRNIVVEVLHQLRYQVLETADAEAGLRALREAPTVDLLVSDIGLPGMDGRKLADAAREIHPQLRVLLMSGYAPAAVAAEGFLDPGMALITKPFSVQALAARIRQVIKQSNHASGATAERACP